MKTYSINHLVLIVLLMGIPILGMAQGTFNAKKKNGTTGVVPILNVLRTDASRSLTKSTQIHPASNFHLQKALSRNSYVPLQSLDNNGKKAVYSSETGLPIFIQTKPESISGTKSTAQQTTSSLSYAYLNELKSILKVDYPEDRFAVLPMTVPLFPGFS